MHSWTFWKAIDFFLPGTFEVQTLTATTAKTLPVCQTWCSTLVIPGLRYGDRTIQSVRPAWSTQQALGQPGPFCQKNRRGMCLELFQPRSPIPRGHPLTVCGPVLSFRSWGALCTQISSGLIAHPLKQDPLSSGESWRAAMGLRSQAMSLASMA